MALPIVGLVISKLIDVGFGLFTKKDEGQGWLKQNIKSIVVILLLIVVLVASFGGFTFLTPELANEILQISLQMLSE